MPPSIRPASSAAPSLHERHYTVDEIAELWNLGYNTVKKIFFEEEGVLRLGEPSRLMGGRKKEYKRRYITLRIPESVMARVRDRLMHKRPAESANPSFVRRQSGGDLHAS